MEGRLAPPLAGAARVIGGKEVLARILLHGRTGQIDDHIYEAGIMAPMGANDDRWIASVLTYIRQEWINQADAIRPDDVAHIRKAAPTRQDPWTLAELTPFDLPLATDRAAGKATASTYDKTAERDRRRPGWWTPQFKAWHQHSGLLVLGGFG